MNAARPVAMGYAPSSVIRTDVGPGTEIHIICKLDVTSGGVLACRLNCGVIPPPPLSCEGSYRQFFRARDSGGLPHFSGIRQNELVGGWVSVVLELHVRGVLVGFWNLS